MLRIDHNPGLPFWGIMSDREKSQLQAVSSIISLTGHTTVFEPHMDRSFLMFLIRGNVKLCRSSYDGREIILRIIGPRQFISFQSIVNNSDMSEYAESVGDCTILRLPINGLQKLMQENWQVSKFFIDQMGARYNRMADRFTQTHQSVFIRKHVVDLLLELSDDIGRKVGDEVAIEHGLTQDELASLIHRTRQSVTVVLSQMKKEGLISYTRTSILIRDLDALKKWGLETPTTNKSND